MSVLPIWLKELYNNWKFLPIEEVKQVEETKVMATAQKGINLIKHFESLHDGDLSVIGLQPKMDSIGIWTEGWGRAMRDSKGDFIKGKAKKDLAYSRITIRTEDEANIALIEDLKKREDYVNRRLKVKLNQNQFDAVVSHTYNTGGSDTLFKLINTQASDKKIRDWFEKHYITASGVIQNGLIRRRKAEADLYFSK